MRESKSDLRALQRLLDHGTETRNGHLRHIFHIPEQTLTAERLTAAIDGRKVAALATVTAAGEPRVAPVDIVLFRGRFWSSSSGGALRVRHLHRRPGVSLTYFEGDDLAVIVHGTAAIVTAEHPDFPGINSLFLEIYGSGVLDWSPDGVYIRIDTTHIYAFASGAH